MKIGICNGGGDCPGLNAVTHGVVGAAHNLGWEVVGFRDGYEGMLSPGDVIELTPDNTRNIQQLGGTMIGTTNKGKFSGKVGAGGVRTIPRELIEDAKGTLKDLGVDAIVSVGGDGTLTSALQLWKAGIPLVGV
ncbi:MAG: 6-phosphofructokinase, partial [Verrucomicrobiota bacterium]